MRKVTQARRDEEQGHPNAAGEESIAEAWPVPGPHGPSTLIIREYTSNYRGLNIMI